ncbi:MAG: HAD-IA family hydrolase [Pseudomonadota bacterium]
MSLRLVVFDVDGTLVDSQAEIVRAMEAAFAAQRLSPPTRKDVLGIVGLSLPRAMSRLAADQPADVRDALVEAYLSAYAMHRKTSGIGPLYPGIRELLDRLAGRDDLLLGVATGKSRHGLNHLIEEHGLAHHFATKQCADDHPSKPNPSMLHAALTETGVDSWSAVMIGDTSYDIEMGRNAKMATIGVTWGYHSRDALAAASIIVDRVSDLDAGIDLALGEIT